MKWQFMISMRYLLERRREKFISVTTAISTLGIAVGVAALIVTMGVMNGFNKVIEEKILDVNPHIIITDDTAGRDHDGLKAWLEDIDEVTGTADFVDGQAIINLNNKAMGVLVRGIDPDPGGRIIKVDSYLAAGSAELDESSVIIGKELANNFRLRIGDKLPLLSPLSNNSADYEITGIFNSGRYDYDLNLIFLERGEAKAFLGDENIVRAIGIKVTDVFRVDRTKREIASMVRPPYRVITWKDIDRNLFSALKLEKIVLFMVVALIIFVACFNIISTLIMTVMEKTKDIGILKAIGVTRRGVMSIFLLEGLYISLIGIMTGAVLGLGICYLQENYELIKLPPDIYYIYSVPVQVRIPDTAVILAAAFALGLLATVYPALHAAKLNPVEALRYE